MNTQTSKTTVSYENVTLHAHIIMIYLELIIEQSGVLLVPYHFLVLITFGVGSAKVACVSFGHESAFRTFTTAAGK